MTEEEFWPALEYRVCREFRGLASRKESSLWCDGFTPQRYDLLGPRPKVLGTVWIMGTHGDASDLPHDRVWEFKLDLPTGLASRDQVKWQELLPPENVTRWLSINFEAKSLRLTPASAVPDAQADGCTDTLPCQNTSSSSSLNTYPSSATTTNRPPKSCQHGYWMPIAYRDFWDVPRIFLARSCRGVYLFDCPFDPEQWDYPDHYTIYEFPDLDPTSLPPSWSELSQLANRRVGEINVKAVQFDETGKQFIWSGAVDSR